MTTLFYSQYFFKIVFHDRGIIIRIWTQEKLPCIFLPQKTTATASFLTDLEGVIDFILINSTHISGEFILILIQNGYGPFFNDSISGFTSNQTVAGGLALSFIGNWYSVNSPANFLSQCQINREFSIRHNSFIRAY